MSAKNQQRFLVTDVKTCEEGFSDKWSNTLIYTVQTESGPVILEMTIDAVKKIRSMPHPLPPGLERGVRFGNNSRRNRLLQTAASRRPGRSRNKPPALSCATTAGSNFATRKVSADRRFAASGNDELPPIIAQHDASAAGGDQLLA